MMIESSTNHDNDAPIAASSAPKLAALTAFSHALASNFCVRRFCHDKMTNDLLHPTHATNGAAS